MLYDIVIDNQNVVFAIAPRHVIVDEDGFTQYLPSLAVDEESEAMGCRMITMDDSTFTDWKDMFDCAYDDSIADQFSRFKPKPEHVAWRAKTNIRMFRDEELVNTDFLAFTTSITEEKRQEYNEWKQRWLDAPDTLHPPLDTPEWIEAILTKTTAGVVGRDRPRRKAVIADKIDDLKLLLQKDMSAEEMLKMIDVYPSWVVGVAYRINDKVRYNGKLYKVIQDHTSQEDWTPDVAVSLFVEIVPEGVIPEWVQPTGAHDAYNTGDKVTFEGSVYESTIDANVWSPTGYPAGWQIQ